MDAERSLWRAVRWPLLLLAIAGVGIGVATVLDRTGAREWALTIGGPALTILLPVGMVWLLVAVILFIVRRQGANSSD
jgi:di/tricarboxylate transporter